MTIPTPNSLFDKKAWAKAWRSLPCDGCSLADEDLSVCDKFLEKMRIKAPDCWHPPGTVLVVDERASNVYDRIRICEVQAMEDI